MPISSDDAAKLIGLFEATDFARSEADKKWGSGRLELLCSVGNPGLLARFRGQQARWRVALEGCWKADFLSRDALAEVERLAGSMQRAWAALDAAAEEAGHRPVAPWVWEVRLADGTVAAFVQTDAEASKVIAEGRHLVVYTAAEVGKLIDMIPEALKLVKVHFPGAKLQAPPPYQRNPDPIPFDDPIPFGEQEDAA